MLFFDRSLGRALPDALALLRLPIKKHDDYFGELTKDEEWLNDVGQWRWTAVTCDDLTKNQMALAAIEDHAVGCFILCETGSQPRWHAARVIARNWDLMERLMAEEPRPFLYRLHLRRAAERVAFPT
jgi:hypothetical protein